MAERVWVVRRVFDEELFDEVEEEEEVVEEEDVVVEEEEVENDDAEPECSVEDAETVLAKMDAETVGEGGGLLIYNKKKNQLDLQTKTKQFLARTRMRTRDKLNK